MCLAIPAKVVSLEGERAKVDFGGVMRMVNVTLVECNVGEYVIVHAGFAIQVLSEKDAQESLKLWREFLKGEEIALELMRER